ncbi:RidA family protein [Alteromonas sp. KUL106]|uniref:RidA family protein n=1 Tax=Alteromonas sp. KUL106 TaxID=2480799 RepID=UPI0012E543CA|nr:RidA family protein [Alteromonas sp. KUL106]GFD68670.1 enamine deaminase RidA [Alteromonas sp. KUL106]
MKLTKINSDRAPKALGEYSQALLVEGFDSLLFISGQIPSEKSGHVPSDFESQCRLAWCNILDQLKAADMEVTSLVKITTYLSSREFAEINGSVRREVLGSHHPALTVIIAGIFDENWLLEIEAYAVK